MYAACVDCKQAVELGKSITVHEPVAVLELLTEFLVKHPLHRIWFGSENEYYELPDWEWASLEEPDYMFAGVYKVVNP